MIGINIGSLNTSISYIKDYKSINMLLSETSNRQFPSLISFPSQERQYGDVALFSLKQNMSSSIISPTRFLTESTTILLKELSLIGWMEDIETETENEIQEHTQDTSMYYVYNKRDNKKIDMIQVNISFIGKIIEYINRNKILNSFPNQTDNKTNYFTVSVPDNYTPKQRNLLQDCIKISSKVINTSSTSQFQSVILNESSAITIFYGIEKFKLFNESQPKVVAFIDIGNSKSSIVFSSFTIKKFEVLYIEMNEFLGSRNFDMKVSEYIVSEFERINKVKVNINNKLRYKLLENSSKARKILTSLEITTISVECLYNDIDFVIDLSRTKLIEIINQDLQQLRHLFSSSLLNFYIKTKRKYKLHSIEMVGDVVRTPSIQSIISEIFNMQLSKTLPTDEAIAKGCCLFSALLSKRLSFSYPFELCQLASCSVLFKVKLVIKNLKDENEKRMMNHEIFNQYSNFPLTVTYSCNEFYDDCQYEIQVLIYDNHSLISKYIHI